MSDLEKQRQEISACKAQQEANREARLRQLYTPAEIWKRQQQDIESLRKLRRDLQRNKGNLGQ